MNNAPIKLPEHDLFDSLNAEQRDRIAAHARTRHLHAGESLFLMGDDARYFWWLQSGQIKLFRLSREGQQKIMGLVEPGRSFAEGILFMDHPRYPVNAEALADSTLLGFERDSYLAILEQSFTACRALLRRMVQRTQHHLDEIEALTLRNARYRLVHYLLHLQQQAPGDTLTLPARKQLIAARLAMQPETLSRLFRELESDRLIHVSGDTVRLDNAAELERRLRN